MAGKEYQKRGYVYVLSNPAMPGIVKIGRSQSGGKQRAGQLYTTGVPVPFFLEFEMLVDDPESIEIAAHETLARYRVNGSREFFACEIDEAVQAVIDAYAWSMDHELVPFDLVWEPESLRWLVARLREERCINTHPIPLFSAIQRHMTVDIAADLFAQDQERARRYREKRDSKRQIPQEGETIQ
jgi:hypothetical protein